MTINNEIKLHPESVDYIEKTLNQYSETDELKIINNPIVHIYAKEDTRDVETGGLNGHTDALFSEFHIYDPKEMTIYKTKGQHDSIMFYNGATPEMVKIFKDGSTLLSFWGKYNFNLLTTVCVHKVN